MATLSEMFVRGVTFQHCSNFSAYVRCYHFLSDLSREQSQCITNSISSL